MIVFLGPKPQPVNVVIEWDLNWLMKEFIWVSYSFYFATDILAPNIDQKF